MLEYLWTQDTHIYANERMRIQVALYDTIILDTAQRPGAFTRSEFYRDGNVALCYKDIEFWAIRKNSGIKFRLDIIFHNMKGARLDDSKL
jgi:hypothetical protein